MKKYELITDELGSKMLKATTSDGKEMWIPLDESNADYQTYLKSLSEATVSPSA